jgi:hypothetical protein
MAKRARGNRPGQRRPTQRSARSSSSTPRPAAPPAATSGATASTDDIALAPTEAPASGEPEAEVVGTAQAPTRTRRGAATNGPTAAGRVAGGGLAVRYAHEYDYVARDLRRIFALMGTLTAALIVIWVVVEASGIIKT